MQREKKEKIGINIFYFSGVNLDERLKNILWGIEEEEIPYILEESSERDGKMLGSMASKSSKFQVGIGIGERDITLYHGKLDVNKPLFRYSIDSDMDILRALGVNGARLIKGNPFIFPENTGGKI